MVSGGNYRVRTKADAAQLSLQHGRFRTRHECALSALCLWRSLCDPAKHCNWVPQIEYGEKTYLA